MIATPAAHASRTSFPSLFSAALKDGSRDTRAYALDLGIDKSALQRYACGAVFDEEERGHVQHVILRNAWSMNYVVNLVKRRRWNRSAA